MGKADKSTRDYINDADVFADAFNYLMYDGDSVVDATTLKPLDTSLLLNIFGIEIDSSEEMINMCKAWQDAQEEAAREAAILTAIELWRDIEISDEIIKDKIMAKYNLTENEADEYMMKTSAITS